MAGSYLIDEVSEDFRANLNKDDKVSKFINSSRRWDLAELIGVLPAHIIEDIGIFLSPILMSKTKLFGNILPTESSLLKQLFRAWANDKILPHPRAKILNCIWKLKINLRKKLLAWKLKRSKLSTREYLTRLGMDINPECHFCNNFMEDMDHLFKTVS